MSEYAIQLLSNEVMHQEFSKNARARAEEFNIDKIILDYENYYIDKIDGLRFP
jgi:glycosyltransferase involved in cell wall biosynthesis